MFAVLRTEQPDVIHAHSIDMTFFVSFAARWYAIPMIHTFHIVTFYDPAQSALRRKAEIWLAKRAKLRKITVPNSYDVKKLRAVGLNQTVLLPNGVDATFWQATPTVKKGETFGFISIGRLEAQKGYEYLVKAARLLTDTRPQGFRLTIVGEGSQKMALQQLIRRLHMEDIVTLVGRKSSDEIRTLFSQADVAVFPSLYETTPITMLEAWAAGVPVIVTPVGIAREVSAGFGAANIVPAKDEQSLMKAMDAWMRNAPARSAAADQARDEVKKYAWPIIAQTAEEMYGDVV
jgi:glycosyltransferase involved in cell wall biosynthesis